MDDNLLNNIRSRPRFKLRTDLSTKEYTRHLREYMDGHKEEFTGIINEHLSTIMIRTAENPYFKPRLTLTIEKEYETQDTVIRGTFGPSQGIWVVFLFTYGIATLGFLFFSFLFLTGLSIESKDFGWALYATLFSLFVGGIAYLLAQYGKKMSQKEMSRLRHFAEQSTAPHARLSVEPAI